MLWAPTAPMALWGRQGSQGLFRGGSDAPEDQVRVLPDPNRREGEFKPVNVCFCGRRGTGKTMAMAAALQRHKRAFTRLKLPWKVISNHWLEFADYNSPMLLDEIWMEDPFKAQKAEIGIDEITSAASSRRATSRTNVHAGRWIEQVRKLPAEILCTTQFPTEVDHYLTRQIDIFIICDANIHPRARYDAGLAAQAYIDLYVFDLWGQWTGRYDMPKLGWPPPIWRADKRMRVWNLPGVWNLYKSQEVIPTMWGSDEYRGRAIAAQWEIGGEPEAKDASSEYFDNVDGDLSQMKKEGGVPPVTEGLDTAARDDRDVIADAGAHGQFVVTPHLMTQVRRYKPNIQNMDLFKVYLDGLGYEVEVHGKQVIAKMRRDD